MSHVDKLDSSKQDRFPVDDAIGKSIKSVFEIIKSNIELRAKNPFVELDILNAIKADSRNFDKILNLGSTCAFMIKLKPSEIKDPLVKSKLLEIGKMEHLEDWQQFHAALHFVRRHIGSDGQLTNTSEIPNGCCPFFDMCTLKSEQKDINICRNRPWESFDATNPEADMCWYGMLFVKQFINHRIKQVSIPSIVGNQTIKFQINHNIFMKENFAHLKIIFKIKFSIEEISAPF